MSQLTVTELFLIAMLLIFGLPYALWRLGRTDYWAPLVVVQIICGILLGPGLLGNWLPAFYQSVFSGAVIQTLNGLAWWAVMLFVWIAGVELDLKQAWQYRRESFITGGLALSVPFLFGAIAALLILQMGPYWLGTSGYLWQFVLGVGMACAVTALPILMLFMEKLGILRSPLGQRILRYASLDDIAIWAVLALILLDWDRLGRQVLFLALFFPASYFIRRLMGRVPVMDRWYLAFIWLAAVALIADWAGLHFMVGAFLAGVIVDVEWLGEKALDDMRHWVLLAFMPVFFLSTGLKTQWQLGGWMVFGAAAILLIAAVWGKLLGIKLAGWILGWQQGDAAIIAWLLQTKALIMIIFANVLLDKSIITADTFTALLLMAIGSTMLTIPRVTGLLARHSLQRNQPE
ncbi:cation:proton antiporter [Simiduia curdlanivorans]|uniref:Cation:proton antiporter n=1 Tax=Simiduia curdlanivorans TaxID=1492769 RepID=A0ABV8V403_9GAMM|nr:cation:proton antiporter [Simiduia curdlanivorans]MDN3638214.1 cation:proton antiporter [Simiduia curdlanivorans]